MGDGFLGSPILFWFALICYGLFGCVFGVGGGVGVAGLFLNPNTFGSMESWTLKKVPLQRPYVLLKFGPWLSFICYGQAWPFFIFTASFGMVWIDICFGFAW
jgi:hypothetical protein